jgi:hypothetical protein
VNKHRDPAPKASKKKRKTFHEGYGEDDTPKAFKRLMQFTVRGKALKGLDDGHSKPKNKKQKVEEEAPTATVDSEAQVIPKIQPGERMSDFAQRVNQALPLTGVQKNRKKIDGQSDHRVTKHEKKLKRLQDGWRKEEVRIREKEQEALELAEEEQDELDAMWEDKTVDLPVGKKAKKGKRKRVVGEVDDEEDPWEALKAKRVQRKGLHDVVQEPPQFTAIPKEKFKVKNGAKVQVADIPNAAGSLRRREELGVERQRIIETYRKLMEAKRKTE